MKYVIGARHDENGNINGGAAGDQTGSEVCVHTLSDAGSFTEILRCPNSAHAAQMVQLAYKIATSNIAGYSQDDRYSLIIQSEKHGYFNVDDFDPCNCDCSSFIDDLVRACGYAITKYMYTGDEKDVLTAAGFECVAYSEGALLAGDILLRSGHTVIYIGTSSSLETDPEPSEPSEPKTNIDYTVQRGDTLTKISNNYGVSIQSILVANAARYPKMTRDYIETGWILTIPIEYILYSVKRGDTLSQLAKTYATTVEDILELNRDRYSKMTRDYIETGWILYIKEGNA